jgi:hypothetical protein
MRWPAPGAIWEECHSVDEDRFTETTSELREITCGSLSVVVDFCELLEEMGEKEAFVMIGKLKDLLS